VRRKTHAHKCKADQKNFESFIGLCHVRLTSIKMIKLRNNFQSFVSNGGGLLVAGQAWSWNEVYIL